MLKRLYFMFAFCCLSVAAMCQVGGDEMMMDGRPECLLHVNSDAEQGGLRNGIRRIGSQQTAPLKARGVKYVPVVLVAFADQAFSVADIIEKDEKDSIISITKGTDEEVNHFYHLYCNGTMDGKLYNGHGSYGSIRDYFIEQSDSVFFPEFTVIGPVTLDSCTAYYGSNSGGRDPKFSKFTSEALRKATTIYNDWDKFDNDSNTTIDMVFFLFAGLGESNTNGKYPNLIWPKETTRSETINGIVFATNAATCEQRPAKWNAEKTQVLESKTDGVGVFVHELSHALGLPDFYDIKYKAFGMDLWSVMDYGEYANSGYTPANYTAYERDFMGWRPMKRLEEPCILTLGCFSDGDTGYVIQNDSSVNEYYVIENRQAKGWDVALGGNGHGLQVTHVDYSESAWKNNEVNIDGKHQRMTIIAANNNYTGSNATKDKKVWLATMSGNLYPGTSMNYALTDDSTPAAEVFTGQLMHKPIRNITENEDGTITLCFRTNGRLETPEGVSTEVQDDFMEINWNTVDYATQYAVELYRDSVIVLNDTVADTNLRVENLFPSNSNLKIRIRAMADTPEDYLDSEWSDFHYFTNLPDFMEDIPQSDRIVTVYALNGIMVGHCSADQLSRLSLRYGVYVIRYENGSARKIMIK